MNSGLFLSVKPNAGGVVFGTSPRGTYQISQNPGPQYDIPAGVGRQVLSSRPSPPGVTFGSDKRDKKIQASSDIGPAAYTLPRVIGHSFVTSSSPAFSLRARSPSPAELKHLKDAASNPGPGSFPIPSTLGHSHFSTIRSPPSYTLKARISGGSPGNLETPSPIAYGNPSMNTTRQLAPSYSIGRRSASPTGRRHDNVDIGPGSYDIVSTTGMGSHSPTSRASPSFSLRARTADPSEVAARSSPTPSPLEYMLPSTLGPQSFVTHNNGAFTMRGRAPERMHPLVSSPGPAAYVLPSGVGPQTSSTSPSAPLFGFGIGDRPSLGGLGAKSAADLPGPASYNVPSAFRALSPGSINGVSVRGRLEYGSIADIARRACSPGPGPTPDVTKLGNHASLRTPGLSRSPRLVPSQAEKDAAAAPATTVHSNIDYHAVLPAAPAFTMRARTPTIYKPSELNGPAAYNLQGSNANKRGSPSWTLKGRWSTVSNGGDNGVPGPNSYQELSLPFYDSIIGGFGGSMSTSRTSRSSSPQQQRWSTTTRSSSRKGGNHVGNSSSSRAPGGGSPPSLLNAGGSIMMMDGDLFEGSLASVVNTTNNSSNNGYHYNRRSVGCGGSGHQQSSYSPSNSTSLRVSAGPSFQSLLNAGE